MNDQAGKTSKQVGPRNLLKEAAEHLEKVLNIPPPTKKAALGKTTYIASFPANNTRHGGPKIEPVGDGDTTMPLRTEKAARKKT